LKSGNGLVAACLVNALVLIVDSGSRSGMSSLAQSFWHEKSKQ
jgi:hypothetical protein